MEILWDGNAEISLHLYANEVVGRPCFQSCLSAHKEVQCDHYPWCHWPPNYAMTPLPRPTPRSLLPHHAWSSLRNVLTCTIYSPPREVNMFKLVHYITQRVGKPADFLRKCLLVPNFCLVEFGTERFNRNAVQKLKVLVIWHLSASFKPQLLASIAMDWFYAVAVSNVHPFGHFSPDYTQLVWFVRSFLILVLCLCGFLRCTDIAGPSFAHCRSKVPHLKLRYCQCA